MTSWIIIIKFTILLPCYWWTLFNIQTAFLVKNNIPVSSLSKGLYPALEAMMLLVPKATSFNGKRKKEQKSLKDWTSLANNICFSIYVD